MKFAAALLQAQLDGLYALNWRGRVRGRRRRRENVAENTRAQR
jgi:hypothetical protein